MKGVVDIPKAGKVAYYFEKDTGRLILNGTYSEKEGKTTPFDIETARFVAERLWTEERISGYEAMVAETKEIAAARDWRANEDRIARDQCLEGSKRPDEYDKLVKYAGADGKFVPIFKRKGAPFKAPAGELVTMQYFTEKVAAAYMAKEK